MADLADRHHIAFLASALTFDALLAAIPLVVLLLVGVTLLAHQIGGADAVTGAELFHKLLPRHPTGDGDPFRRVEQVLVSVTEVRGQASLVAAPTFLWLSMRLFAAVRISLDTIFHAHGGRAVTGAAKILGFVLSKVRDAAMVLVTVALFLANSALTAALSLAQTAGAARVPALAFFVTEVGRVLAEVLAVAFSVLPFFLIYRFATTKPLRTRPAFYAACFTAFAFELAKRLYGNYLSSAGTLQTVARGDADLLAGLLFVLWVHVTGIVFLLGAAVASTSHGAAKAPAARKVAAKRR